MGEAVYSCSAGNFLWFHLWIDHMYFLLANGESFPDLHVVQWRGATGE